jgi:hypothetical protein
VLDSEVPLPRLRFSPVLVLFLLAAAPVGAATITINNGLAPPNSANVIDANNSFPSDRVIVANVGCEHEVPAICDSLGAPTSVELRAEGEVGNSVLVFESSQFKLAGGSILSGPPGGGVHVLGASGSSVVTITDGRVDALVLFGASSATMTGGSVRYVQVGGATMSLQGGRIDEIQVYDGGTVTVFGASFSVDGTPVPFGVVMPDFGELTGTSLFGDPIDILFTRRAFDGPGTGALVLVPEPSTALLLVSGLLGLVVKFRPRAAASSASVSLRRPSRRRLGKRRKRATIRGGRALAVQRLGLVH